MHLMQSKTFLYNIELHDCDLFLMSRPRLSAAEFNVPITEVNKILEQNLDNDLNDKYLNYEKFNLAVANKANNVKKYLYENIIINNYGDPIFNTENKLIGYKINNY